MWVLIKTVLFCLLLIICCTEFRNFEKISKNSELSALSSEVMKSEVSSDVEKPENGTSAGTFLNRRIRDVSGEKLSYDQISLVIIFDTTGSMENDLAELGKASKDIIYERTKKGNIHNYILVGFNDPDIDPPFVNRNYNEFLEKLGNITVDGGIDCPELAIGRLVRGLEAALSHSQVYVFTDAAAKDYNLSDEAGTLIQSKQITVSFLLTSICDNSSYAQNAVFHELAEQSNGQVYNITSNDIKKVMEAISSNLDPSTTVIDVERKPPGINIIKIDVEKTMKNLTVEVSGSDPKINIKDPKGKPFKATDVITLSHLKIIMVDEPNPGKYQIQTESTSNHSIKITGSTDVRIKYGMSFDPPYNFSDTVTNPIKNVDNILSIFVQKTDNLYNMTEAEIVLANPAAEESFSNVSTKRLAFPDCRTGSCMYVAEGFKPPLGRFKIYVKGFDSDGNPFRYLASNTIQAVDGDLSKPKVTIDRATIEVVEGENVKIMCKVVSPIPPTVNWIIRDKYVQPNKTEKTFSNENSTFYYSYIINNVNEGNAGRYVCSAKNPYGKESAEVSLKVKLIPLRVQLKETNMNATENVENYEINCIISPPERKVTITWLLDDELLKDSIDVQISSNNLLLKLVNRKHAGKITCRGYDGRKKLESSGTLNVHYEAEIIGPHEENHNITFDERVVLNCSAIGNPIPTIIWRKENSTKVDNIIEKFAPNDYGKYVCEASNGIGSPSRKYVHLNSTAKGPPTLIHSAYLHRLKLDDNLKLKCGCDQCGPIIHSSWKYFPGSDLHNNSKTLNGAKPILEDRSKNFQYDFELKNVKESDDGYYICAIGNKFGVKTAVMHVQVLSEKPTITYMGLMENKNVSEGYVKLNRGGKATFICMVRGNPNPKIEWSKDGVRLLPMNEMTLNGLTLHNIRENESGKYKCLARNSKGEDFKELQLYVTRPFLKIKTIIETYEGQLVILPCIAERWTFNYNRFEIKKPFEIIKPNDLLFKASYNNSGVYQCLNEDETQVAAETVLIVYTVPTLVRFHDKFGHFEPSASPTLIYQIEGYPIPKIEWTFHGTKDLNSSTTIDSKGGKLMLSNINEGMTGAYVCHAINKAGHSQQSTYINIRKNSKSKLKNKKHKPYFWDTNGKKSKSVRPKKPKIKRDKSQLSCKAETGTPKPYLVWTFNNTVLLDSGNIIYHDKTTDEMYLNEFGNSITEIPNDNFSFNGMVTLNKKKTTLKLTFAKETAKMFGTYTCHAVNIAGMAQKDFVYTPTYDPPFLVGNALDKKHHVKLQILAGLPLFLTCHWYSESHLETVWTKNEISLDRTFTIENSNEFITTHRHNSTLIKENTQGTDSALYICNATNGGGSNIKTFNVTVHELPYYSTNTASEISLNCPISDRSSYVYWEERILGTNRNYPLARNSTILSNEYIQDNSIYTCYTINESRVTKKIIEILMIRTPTVQSYDIEKVAPEDHTLILNCPIMILDSRGLHVDWFKNGEPLVVNSAEKTRFFFTDRMTLTIYGPKKSDSGIYKCQIQHEEANITVKIQRPTEWSAWEWKPCNKECDVGTREANRTCVLFNEESASEDDEPCEGPNSKSENCNPMSCPVNGGWGEWKNQTGTKIGHRVCNKPPPFNRGYYCD